MSKNQATSRAEELRELQERAEEHPGVKELMEVYGQSEEYVVMAEEYLNASRPKPKIINSNTSQVE